MVLGNHGYVFSLLIAAIMVLTLSLVLFKTQIMSPEYESSSNKLKVDQLHFFVESIKDDASRAISISGQRSAAYAINHIILTNESFRQYHMNNCTSYNHSRVGIESALLELMICGDLSNVVHEPNDINSYMANNTILEWESRLRENSQIYGNYNLSVSFKDSDLALIDSWHFAVISHFDIFVTDGGKNRFIAQDLPITSIVDIRTMEDPMYYMMSYGKTTSDLRTFTPCEKRNWINGSILDDWIESGCYISSENSYYGPSFFDRLENNSQLDLVRFKNEKYDFYQELGYPPKNISLESLINIDLMREYGIPVNSNLSQVDYYYWNPDIAEESYSHTCYVDGMERHPNFKIDVFHAKEHNVRDLNCHVSLVNYSSDPADFEFIPSELRVPPNTTITFVDKTGSDRELNSYPVDFDDPNLYANGMLRKKYDLLASPFTNYYIKDTETEVEFQLAVELT